MFVVATVIAIGAVVAVRLLTRTDTRTTARSVAEALDEFRSVATVDSSAVPEPSDVLPTPGVYVYRTSGSEGVDALGGAVHEYPERTTMTVRAAGCGVTSRWDVAEERWEELTACAVDGGVARVAFTDYHEFFGIGQTHPETCEGDPRPLGAAPGTTWTFACTDTGSTTPWSGAVLGQERLLIGGVSVDTDHVVTIAVDDPDDDEMRIETWYLAGTDVVVREIGSRRSTNPSPVGEVHYREDYEIELTSLEPMR